MQLKSAKAELKQARTALKTMEGSDGNALEVTVRMQKQITAKRGQIDALQSKIKFLEEAMANAAKEKHYLREENSKLSQKLSCIRAENIRIAGDLGILRTQDKRLKEKLSKMETALDKVRFLLLAYLTPKDRSGLTGTEIPDALQASLQFAECQCIIQRHEQEVMRFRLQHTLDVKELQGPGYSSASASGKLQHIVPLSHLHSALQPLALHLPSSAPQMHSKLDILEEEPWQDLKRILQELTSSDSDMPSVDLSSNGGGKSPLTTMGNAVDPSCSHPAHLQSQDVSLLVACLASHPMETSEPTPKRLQNKMESLQNLVESLQLKKQATSPTIRTQEAKTKQSKGKERKLSK